MRSMGAILKAIVKEVRVGMGQVLVISPDRAYVRTPKNGFLIDNANLRSDVKKVGRDLKVTVQRYSNGEPTYQR